jgi:DNA-binding transcriptional ArsR family regulator
MMVLMKKKLNELKTKQDHLFNDASSILSSLSAPVRIKLIHFLSQAPLTVEVLSGKLGQSVANTSMHLRKMLE